MQNLSFSVSKLTSLLLLWCLAGPSTSLGQHIVKTDHLAMSTNTQEGTIVLQVLGADGGQAYQTDIYRLTVDEDRQVNFSVVNRDPLTLQNDTIEIIFEVFGSRSIAVTQRARDNERHQFELAIHSSDQTRYYGGGERFNALNQRGHILPMLSDDRYGNKGVGAHKPVPFVMSSQGLGFWLDSYAPSQFDLSGTERFATTISVRDTKMRTVFFGGPDMTDILNSFTRLTGRTPVPPPWAFGLWKSRDVHHNQDSVLVDIKKPRELNIPASVIVLDSPWETGYNNFEVNKEQFPYPQKMFDRIQQRGYYLALWLTPFINSENVQDMEGVTPASSNYDEAIANDVLVTDSTGDVAKMDWWKGTGGLIDFTYPTAVDWWFDQLDKTSSTGVRAFKVDDGEGNFVPQATFHDGTPAYKMQNRYSVLYDSVMQAYVDQRLNGNGVLITRTGYTGTQQYPFAWAGDNKGDFSFDEGLPSVILAGQNAAMSGFSLWGSDIAGYAGTADKEVFIRWTQFAAFTPFMQVHMTSNKGPWDYDRETVEIFRRFTQLRTQLFPYLYDVVHQSHEKGTPVMRPMPLAFPDDPKAEDRIYQYMFGPDLLVAPVYQRVKSRSVYLPEGKWTNFWDGKKHTGPKDVVVEAPLNQMPLFVRSGSVLPMIPDDVETLVRRHDKMDHDIAALDDRRVIQVWPGGVDSIKTWDGLEVAKTSGNGRYQLSIIAPDLRPVKVEFPFQRLKIEGVSDNAVSYDDKHEMTVVKLPEDQQKFELTWTN